MVLFPWTSTRVPAFSRKRVVPQPPPPQTWKMGAFLRSLSSQRRKAASSGSLASRLVILAITSYRMVASERVSRAARFCGTEMDSFHSPFWYSLVVAGCGGLGSPVAVYLAVAGMGTIRLIDHDKVELSNLNRQILHWDKDIGKGKAESAAEKLRQLNPEVYIEAIDVFDNVVATQSYQAWYDPDAAVGVFGKVMGNAFGSGETSLNFWELGYTGNLPNLMRETN